MHYFGEMIWESQEKALILQRNHNMIKYDADCIEH